jgi:hypothetical protein
MILFGCVCEFSFRFLVDSLLFFGLGDFFWKFGEEWNF